MGSHRIVAQHLRWVRCTIYTYRNYAVVKVSPGHQCAGCGATWIDGEKRPHGCIKRKAKK